MPDQGLGPGQVHRLVTHVCSALRSPQAVRHLCVAGGDADPQAGRPAKVIGGRAVGAGPAGPAVDWHCVLRVIGIDRCDQRCRTAARVSVTQLTHLVSACQHSRPHRRTVVVVKCGWGGPGSEGPAKRPSSAPHDDLHPLVGRWHDAPVRLPRTTPGSSGHGRGCLRCSSPGRPAGWGAPWWAN